MKQFILDCSVAISWCLPDETDEYAEAILDLLTSTDRPIEAIVPTIWSLELINVFLVAERRQRISLTEVETAIALIHQLPIAIDSAIYPEILHSILGLGRKYSIAAYDAAYLELAIRLGLPLATNDQRLMDAAQQTNVFLAKENIAETRSQ
ncbi:MAG: type II toxin-antitoxin system VapC family toxin [Leptolyngbyaceae bacterium]|nr:type II toxin-antitoxin system VapC family toxin [Leptolyngbyaceae bacterium]